MDLIRINTTNGDDFNLFAHLQTGVWVGVGIGETVFSFVLRILSIDSLKMEAEVQTLLLNSRVVDEPETAFLQPGDTLVLSGAMPGLVGAMLRSKSPIKTMRSEISGLPGRSNEEIKQGFVKVKLFNTVLKNHLRDLLICGFYIEEGD